MGTQIFLGEPPVHIKQWIKDHHGSGGHADTWYKYAGDTEWRTVSITGEIAGDGEFLTPTTQIPSASYVVALEIGEDVMSIGDYAFCNCNRLTSVTIPDSVTSIGNSAFYCCSGLTSVTIPESVTSIGNSAFYGCSGLTSVTIPDSVTRIGDWAFCWCSKLTSVTIPIGVTSIGSYAFYDCSSLTSLQLNSYVLTNSTNAFYNAYKLSEINAPNMTVDYVAANAAEWAIGAGFKLHTVVVYCSDGVVIVNEGADSSSS